jgi:hypothetical protein
MIHLLLTYCVATCSFQGKRLGSSFVDVEDTDDEVLTLRNMAVNTSQCSMRHQVQVSGVASARIAATKGDDDRYEALKKAGFGIKVKSFIANLFRQSKSPAIA